MKHNLKRSKYNAKKTEVDGITFDSKKEAEYYCKLKLAKKSGKLLTFLMQVPFHLPGKGKYVCDFEEFWADGTLRFVDVKGVRTPTYKMKKKMVEELYYPITIEEV